MKGYKTDGSPTIGGAITTASGLTFVAGTMDPHLRAIDSQTGHDIAQFDLPYIGGSLPIIYSVRGREYLVICCGGHLFLGSNYGDQVMAYALRTAKRKPAAVKH